MGNDINKIQKGAKLTAKLLKDALLEADNTITGGSRVLMDGDIIKTRPPLVGARQFFYARIGAATPVAAAVDNQWSYKFTEMQKSSQGYGASSWIAKPNGRDDTLVGSEAWNFLENENAATGWQGNGVEIPAIPVPGDPTIVIHEVGFNFTDKIMVLMQEVNLLDGSKEYWFQYPNPIEVIC